MTEILNNINKDNLEEYLLKIEKEMPYFQISRISPVKIILINKKFKNNRIIIEL